VIGGGLVGLATARAFLLRRPGSRVVVLEKEPELARHQSGRNSGVVHAGLYYPAGSLKAQLCREGREELLDFADEHEIPYTMSGKLVVAIDELELPRLEELLKRGTANGLQGLRELDASELHEIEPNVTGLRALHVPETAVIDFREVVGALARELERQDAKVKLDAEVVAIERRNGSQVLRTSQGETVAASLLVSCAGVQSDRVAALSGTAPKKYRIAPFRGDFYRLSLSAASLVNGLIYPVPDPAFPFLGVHFTRRIDGEVWAGPNAVPSLAREKYGRLSFDARDAFDMLGYVGLWRLGRRYYRTGAGEIWRDFVKRAAVAQMRRYLPALRARDVAYGPSGIRAQGLAPDGTLVDDFLLERDAGTVSVLNAPSPAATASLAIGGRIADAVVQP
jgi:L-2-hydroxyglutarate oxidase LhgO